MVKWIKVCKKEEIEVEDLIRFDFENKTFAIYCSPSEEYFCTDGICTHENVHLEDGLVMDDIIECPMHNGQFNYKTGKAVRSPACDDLKTYDLKIIEDDIYIDIDGCDFHHQKHKCECFPQISPRWWLESKDSRVQSNF